MYNRNMKANTATEILGLEARKHDAKRSGSMSDYDHYWRVSACLFDEKYRRYYFVDKCNACDLTNASFVNEDSAIASEIVRPDPTPHALGSDL